MSKVRTIVIPHMPREHQAQLSALRKLVRFFIANIHRRFGKTVWAINEIIDDVLQCKLPKPRGAYIAPFRTQAKQIAWEYLKDYTRPIPGMKFNESELRADFPTGARITLYGADNYNSLRGIYLDSVVLDEVAQMAPSLWTKVIRPTLSDRKGRAIFIGTPFGMMNIFYRLYEKALDLADWARITLAADDTKVIEQEELDALKREMAVEEYEQEYGCSWSAAIKGAFFGRQMAEIEEAGQITSVPYDEAHPVVTTWDLGVSDSTVVWYLQLIGAQIRALRCEAFQGMKLKEIIEKVGSHGYTFSQHIAPFDINVRELGEGSRIRQALKLGIKFDVAPGPRECSRQSGINAVRTGLARCWFDRELCADGIEALKGYRTEYNELRMVYSTNPLHDWCSDYADSLRYFFVTKQRNRLPGAQQQRLDYSKRDAGRH